MELGEARNKASQILSEESVHPTLMYLPTSTTNVQGFGEATLALFAVQQIREERQQRIRRVHEVPDKFYFKSTNYELLLALFSQVSENDHTAFVASLLTHISGAASPLVAEFCVRTRHASQLFRAIAAAPLTRGLVLVVKQLQDTIALNFNVLSDEELERVAAAITATRERASRKAYKPKGKRGAVLTPNPEYDATLAPIARELMDACDSMIEECRQARYWYLKGALQQQGNLEINQDRGKVEDYLTRLGFSDPLSQALNTAEQDFRASSTPFQLKSCLAHLRSFLERLHEESCKRILASVGPGTKKWGETTERLSVEGILSAAEKNFVISLYSLLSDMGVHPVMAEHEYARLLRNVVIEYGLMLLTKLEKSGRVRAVQVATNWI